MKNNLKGSYVKNLFKTLLLAVLLNQTSAFAASCNMPAQTSWTNLLGSKMELLVDKQGTVIGTFKTAIGCGVDVERAVVGTCSGDAITFSVNWQECASVTSWTGIYEEGKITSVWNLVVADAPQEVHNGADIFSIEAK